MAPHAPKIVNLSGHQPCLTIKPLPFEPWLTQRVFILDLGASLFSTWSADPVAAAGSWLHHMLSNKKIHITHYWAFEAALQTPQKIWSSVPIELRGKYTYINLPVSSDPSSADYPWLILEQVATPQDYVIIKLDIDTPEIENALVDHLLASPKYMSLIDDFFYEHHIDIRPMHPWWGAPSGGHLSDTYRIFTQLRKNGVRSHAWP